MATSTKAGPKFFTVPAGSKSVPCRGSTCGKRIYFVRTNTGRVTPIDVDVDGGRAPSEASVKGEPDLFGVEVDVHDGRGVSHFLTCASADEFSRDGAR